MKTIGIIGNLDNSRTGGQITKTQELLKFIHKRYGELNAVDVNLAKNPITLCFKMQELFKNSRNIVVILATPGYVKILPIVVLLSKVYKKPVYEFVIGGIRHEYLKENKGRISWEKQIEKIYVESTYMEEEYKKLGLENAEYMPNYKSFVPIERKDLNVSEGKHLSLCTFSRIDCNKGIDVAIEIVNGMLNEGADIKLDIIGPIDETYVEDFKKLMKNVSSAIQYKGAIKSDESIDMLKKYDLLLCPTKWKTEGFPGAFIDAMAAGLPILATDKINFRDIITDGYNGYLIDYIQIEEYRRVIRKCCEDKEWLYRLKENALLEVNKYKSETVLKKFWEYIEEVK